jgi:DNA-binding NarL/FixJ family response regulator
MASNDDTKIIQIALVDDHNLFRDGMKLLLSNYPHIKVMFEASDGKEFLEMMEKKYPDVVLMDIDMPRMNGIDATREAAKRFPKAKIIALSMYGEAEYYYKMIDSGVKGFVLKNSDISEVIDAIECIYSGESFFSQELLNDVVRNIKKHDDEQESEDKLSKREVEILTFICQGLSNQEIADYLSISRRTVDKHRENLLLKTCSKNTASLVIFAIKNKLVELI